MGRNNHVNTYGGVALHESDTPGIDQSDKPDNGRFPANVILTYDDTDYEEVCGGMPNTSNSGGKITHKDFSKHKGSMMHNSTLKEEAGQFENGYVAPSDSGSAARYFYCAKASKKDRDEGLDVFETKQCVGGGGGIGDYLNDVNSASGKFGSEKAPHKNIHPTVKPTSLMQYLVRLVTPNGGTILDPFNGSGSTGKAVMFENAERHKYVFYKKLAEAIKEDPRSMNRIKNRITDAIEYAIKTDDEDQEESNSGMKQMSIFDFIES